MIFRAHPYSVNNDTYDAFTYIRVKDVERIKQLTKELEKYGVVVEVPDAIEQQTNLHLIVKVPYKKVLIEK